MRKISVAFVFICAILVGCAAKFEPANPDAFGMRWELLGVDLQNVQTFYAPQTLTYSEGITKYRFRGVYAQGYESTGWAELDCGRSLIRAFDMEAYDKYYRLVGRFPDQPWQGVPKNSVIDQSRSRLCK